MPQKLTQLEFIQRAKNKNSNYAYDLVDYKNTNTKVIIICTIHGSFLQRPKDHLNGHGCPKCKADKNSKRCLDTADIFKIKADKLHSQKYDYSLVKYTGTYDKVWIRCPLHNKFLQRPNDHLNGKGCPKCGLEIIQQSAKEKRITEDEFVLRASKKQKNRYNYSSIIFTDARTKVLIGCSLHGNFWQTPEAHLRGQGCPKCRLSKGEQAIDKYLAESNIGYVSQYKFKDCRYKYALSFDFAILRQDTPIGVIEYQGEQHYRPMRYNGGDLKFGLRNMRDAIKKSYCEAHNIPLLIVPYTEFNNIDTHLSKFLRQIS